mmetsp:Transcript_115013/g.330392  ORF Transcript_115013/g.330392 Transcript_115013/m.330392 type:complete len:261 (-) Transcript_115013:755-1537(-)
MGLRQVQRPELQGICMGGGVGEVDLLRAEAGRRVRSVEGRAGGHGLVAVHVLAEAQLRRRRSALFPQVLGDQTLHAGDAPTASDHLYRVDVVQSDLRDRQRRLDRRFESSEDVGVPFLELLPFDLLREVTVVVQRLDPVQNLLVGAEDVFRAHCLSLQLLQRSDGRIDAVGELRELRLEGLQHLLGDFHIHVVAPELGTVTATEDIHGDGRFRHVARAGVPHNAALDMQGAHVVKHDERFVGRAVRPAEVEIEGTLQRRR